MNDRQQRIQLLSRINRGKKAAPLFLRELSQILGADVGLDSLVDLEETDRISTLFWDGYHSAVAGYPTCIRRHFRSDECFLVFQLADCIAAKIGAESCLILTKQSDDCGAVRLMFSDVMKHACMMIRLDGDSVSAISSDCCQGLLLDRNQDNIDETFELAIWGDRWSLAALTCFSKIF